MGKVWIGLGVVYFNIPQYLLTFYGCNIHVFELKGFSTENTGIILLLVVNPNQTAVALGHF